MKNVSPALLSALLLAGGGACWRKPTIVSGCPPSGTCYYISDHWTARAGATFTADTLVAADTSIYPDGAGNDVMVTSFNSEGGTGDAYVAAINLETATRIWQFDLGVPLSANNAQGQFPATVSQVTGLPVVGFTTNNAGIYILGMQGTELGGAASCAGCQLGP